MFASGIGLGSDSQSGGTINISGGIITAQGGSNSSGIGAGLCSKNCIINISGGRINATAGPECSAAIGSSNGYGSEDGTCTISGGMVNCDKIKAYRVIINGGSVAASSITPAPVNSMNENVYKSSITLRDDKNSTIVNSDVTINGANVGTDSNGKVYLYLPAGSNKVDFAYKGIAFSNNINVTSDGNSTKTLSFAICPILSVTLNTPANLVQVDKTEAVNFIATPDANGAFDPSTIEWYVNSVKQSVSGTTFTYEPTNAGTYTISVKVSDNPNAMVDSKTITVTITPSISITSNTITKAGNTIEGAATVRVVNADTTITSGVVMLCVYSNTDGRLVGSAIKTVPLTFGSNDVAFNNISLANITEQAYTVKVMCFSSLDKMRPIAHFESFSL